MKVRLTVDLNDDGTVDVIGHGRPSVDWCERHGVLLAIGLVGTQASAAAESAESPAPADSDVTRLLDGLKRQIGVWRRWAAEKNGFSAANALSPNLSYHQSGEAFAYGACAEILQGLLRDHAGYPPGA